MTLKIQLHCLLLLALSSSILSRPIAPEETSSSNSKSGSPSRASGEQSTFFEGDIALGKGQKPYRRLTNHTDLESEKSKRQVENTDSGDDMDTGRDDIWKDGVIYFKFDGTLVSMYRDWLDEVMQWWTDATNGCIIFNHTMPNTTDYILFKYDEKKGCTSFIGRRGGVQDLTISGDCEKGNIAHELGHAIGLWHEHSRPDRDTYIQIVQENILEDKEQNFGILSDETFAKVPKVPYDIGSIMHYGKNAFVREGRNLTTILIKENAPWDKCDDKDKMGQRTEISHKDALRVKLLYGCGHVSASEKICNNTELPTPTPTTPTPIVTTVTIPTPTATNKLQTNDIITLQMGNPKNSEDTLFGMRCVPSPGCTPTPCYSNSIFGNSASHCSNIENKFIIVQPDDKKISVGDKVLLRSVFKPSMWLNCSNAQTGCTISPCTSNTGDPSNSSYTSDCEEHFFIISAKKRAVGKVLSTKHKIQFKSFKDDSYLNCAGKKCELISNNECADMVDGQEQLQPKNNDGTCNIQYFNVAKV